MLCHGSWIRARDVRDIYEPVLSRAFAADPKARPDFDTLGCQHERVYRILAECYRDGKGVAPDPAKSRYYRLKGR